MKSITLSLGVIRKFTSATTLTILVASLFTLTGCQKENEAVPEIKGERTSGFIQDEKQVDANGTGTSSGFFWSIYTEGGTSSITQGTGGNFSISYSNVRDVVGGKGWNPGSARNIGYNIGALSGSRDFVGIYGWTTNPLIEYYVSEFGSIPASTTVNTVNSDGHTYTFRKNQRVNAPSIQGTATFWQYIDNWGGATTGTNRNVNMANHINNWRARGGQGFGSYNYQILAVEAFNGKSGYINATVW